MSKEEIVIKNPRPHGKNTFAYAQFFQEGKDKSVVFKTPDGDFMSPKAIQSLLEERYQKGFIDGSHTTAEQSNEIHAVKLNEAIGTAKAEQLDEIGRLFEEGYKLSLSGQSEFDKHPVACLRGILKELKKNLKH